MEWYTFFLAVFTMAVAVIIVVLSVFDRLTIEFTRKAKWERKMAKKGEPLPQGSLYYITDQQLEDFTARINKVVELVDEAFPSKTTFVNEDALPGSDEDSRSHYCNRFFAKGAGGKRTQTYVHGEVYQKIKEFLSVAAPRTSITSYINNILSQHLEEHRDVIEEMLRQEMEGSKL